eukprot:6196029-Pleurochrysis_carterae.AAC.1
MMPAVEFSLCSAFRLEVSACCSVWASVVTAATTAFCRPFDRWLGLDKDLVEEESQSVQSVTYVDPTDTSNYVTVSLAKPMGIAFVENEASTKTSPLLFLNVSLPRVYFPSLLCAPSAAFPVLPTAVAMKHAQPSKHTGAPSTSSAY